MSVRIRLRRVGRKKQPSYRVVIAERRAARDGAYIETIGSYQPRRQPAQLRLDMERVDYWLGQGAEPSTTVHGLILKARKGGDAKVALVTAESEAAAAPAAEAEAEDVAVEVEPEPTSPDPEEAKAERKSRSGGRTKTAKAEAAAEEPEAPEAEAEEKE